MSSRQNATIKQKQQEVAGFVSCVSNKSEKSKSLSNKAIDSSDEDSELDQNFALLSRKRSSGITDEDQEESRSEEEDDVMSGDGLEEDSDDGVDEDAEGDDTDDGDEDATGSGCDTREDEEDDDDDAAKPATENSGEIQTEEDIKKELSTMSFEEIMALQNKVGTKVYNEIAYGNTKLKNAPAKKKRLNKNRPMEISAKRPAPFLRQVVQVKKTVSRDPRFDDLSGEYKPEIFEKTYRFINDIKQREREVVQKRLKKPIKSVQKKDELQFLLKRMENQERARKTREEQREKELEFKRKQREMAGQGLKPFFLKKSDKKKLELAEKYSELKKSGKLENFLSKKRKRNAGKDRRKLPYQKKTQ
ncbi:ribosomal RNA processing protein 36 homolog [Esox lucius]|uniref:rRNA biogenesis protein RRP36 n=1 Tax=Esox lucius TaxID=8010 RepID=A0A3P9A9E5_ESOLU|nr:ribosomal RNA processing protein 36 homolog [Esox lucius]